MITYANGVLGSCKLNRNNNSKRKTKEIRANKNPTNRLKCSNISTECQIDNRASAAGVSGAYYSKVWCDNFLANISALEQCIRSRRDFVL